MFSRTVISLKIVFCDSLTNTKLPTPLVRRFEAVKCCLDQCYHGEAALGRLEQTGEGEAAGSWGESAAPPAAASSPTSPSQHSLSRDGRQANINYSRPSFHTTHSTENVSRTFQPFLNRFNEAVVLRRTLAGPPFSSPDWLWKPEGRTIHLSNNLVSYQYSDSYCCISLVYAGKKIGRTKKVNKYVKYAFVTFCSEYGKEISIIFIQKRNNKNTKTSKQ